MNNEHLNEHNSKKTYGCLLFSIKRNTWKFNLWQSTYRPEWKKDFYTDWILNMLFIDYLLLEKTDASVAFP